MKRPCGIRVIRGLGRASLVCAFAGWAMATVHGQPYDRIARERVTLMFEQVREEIRKTYYDPTFHGLDFDGHFKRAGERLDQATSLRQGLGIIAQTLLDFNDSHLYFDPPSRTVTVQYGYELLMVGQQCFVVAVNPKSDAWDKGLRPGDLVLSVQGFKPTRSDLWKMSYFFYTLSPQASLKLSVQSPGAQPRTLEVAARVQQSERLVSLLDTLSFDVLLRSLEDATPEQRLQYVGDVTIWKMSSFDVDPDELMRAIRGRVKGAALVLDLRGNRGGLVDTLTRLVAYVFDHEVKIADVKGRKETKPLVAKKKGRDAYAGRLVVLVDSYSSSAAELFARVMQMEKRGTVIGDRSAGAVMQAHYFSGQIGAERLVLFGASVTDADMIMSDGKSLEGAGVEPDELLLPTAEDLAASRDPALARAATVLGASLTPEAAGKLFPRTWR